MTDTNGINEDFRHETVERFNTFRRVLSEAGYELRIISEVKNELADLRLYQVSPSPCPDYFNICVAIFTLDFKVFTEQPIINDDEKLKKFLFHLEHAKQSSSIKKC